MTRLPLLDPHAQAAHRVHATGRGHLLLPTDPIFGPYGPAPTTWTSPVPLPEEEQGFYVGEGHYANYFHRVYQYRAAGQPKPDGKRWAPAHQMPEWAARSRFRVLSVRVVRLGDVTEAQAATMGLPTARVEGMPDRVQPDAYLTAPTMQGTEPDARTALRVWYPVWTGRVWSVRSWAYLAEVEAL